MRLPEGRRNWFLDSEQDENLMLSVECLARRIGFFLAEG